MNNIENENPIITEEDIKTEQPPEFEENKNIFDSIADFFQLMALGGLKFVIFKLPKYIWNILKKINVIAIFKYLYSIWRAIFWITIFIFLLCLVFILTVFEKFKAFWIWVWNCIVHIIEIILPHLGKYIWTFLKNYGGYIWFFIFAIAAICALLYLKKKDITWRNFFPKFKKKNKKNSIEEK